MQIPVLDKEKKDISNYNICFSSVANNCDAYFDETGVKTAQIKKNKIIMKGLFKRMGPVFDQINNVIGNNDEDDNTTDSTPAATTPAATTPAATTPVATTPVATTPAATTPAATTPAARTPGSRPNPREVAVGGSRTSVNKHIINDREDAEFNSFLKEILFIGGGNPYPQVDKREEKVESVEPTGQEEDRITKELITLLYGKQFVNNCTLINNLGNEPLKDASGNTVEILKCIEGEEFRNATCYHLPKDHGIVSNGKKLFENVEIMCDV
jgi:hypothetical protein